MYISFSVLSSSECINQGTAYHNYLYSLHSYILTTPLLSILVPWLQMTEDEPLLSIPEFYAGRNVFITGGTGFMGKVLVEKLLRSIPDIGNIYLLVRPKRNKTVEDRKKALLSSVVSLNRVVTKWVRVISMYYTALTVYKLLNNLRRRLKF